MQRTLLLALLNDYISEANMVRAIDVFAEALNLGKLGIAGVTQQLWADDGAVSLPLLISSNSNFEFEFEFTLIIRIAR